MKLLNNCYIFSKLQKVGLVQLKLALDPGPIELVQAGPACGQSS